MSTIQFTPLGGVSEIGANAYLLEIGGLRILLDCGLHPKKEGREALPAFEYLADAPDAICISHAHIDHCGALPYLAKMFPGAAVYATKPTLSMMDRMLHNSVSVMGILRDERNIPEYPLYEHSDADAVMKKAMGIEMDVEFALHPESPVRVTFHPSGHVLGGATMRIATPDHAVYYTGDICTVDQELMRGYRPPNDAASIQTLVIESTYGANEAADDICYTDEMARFAQSIEEVLDAGGTVLVPCFALGRTQEILNMIARLQETGAIPQVPVYASGLGRAIYEVYDRFQELLKPGAVLSPLSQFHRISDAWDPNAVQDLVSEPCIIVATSGMMIENTPSALIARRMITEERHGIFFVGYCDPDTLGYKLRQAQAGEELVFALGTPAVPLKLTNIGWFHFSAHAPRKALREVVDRFHPQNLILVHGDEPAVEWMRDNCGDGCAKFAPRVGETLHLSP